MYINLKQLFKWVYEKMLMVCKNIYFKDLFKSVYKQNIMIEGQHLGRSTKKVFKSCIKIFLIYCHRKKKHYPFLAHLSFKLICLKTFIRPLRFPSNIYKFLLFLNILKSYIRATSLAGQFIFSLLVFHI